MYAKQGAMGSSGFPQTEWSSLLPSIPLMNSTAVIGFSGLYMISSYMITIIAYNLIFKDGLNIIDKDKNPCQTCFSVVKQGCFFKTQQAGDGNKAVS